MAFAPPNLQVWPNSGLSIAWQDTIAQTGGTGSMHLGPDGVGLGMTIRVYWSDLQVALQELLGYSYREVDAGVGPVLRRILPWQHPYFNQLVVKSVQSVHGEISQGNSLQAFDLFDFGVAAGGFGQGFGINNGPWAVFKFALITVQFWRPPYYLRTDADIVAPTGPLAGLQQEWLRYVDKGWQLNTQMLVREGATFVFAPGQGSITGQQFVGAVGQKVSHQKVKRTWYQVPEAGIFETLEDGTPNGEPVGLMYMKTPTTNPVTGYVQAASTNPADPGYQAFPILGCVNSPIGGGVTNTFIDGTDLRFLGSFMGTLLLEAIALVPRDLQLPAYLMAIPVFERNEPISQVQYDVEFHYDKFDPPRPTGLVTNTSTISGVPISIGTPAVNTAPLTSGPINQAYRGHNLKPYQDALWYMPVSQLTPLGASAVTTAFQYADLSDCFFII